MGILTKGAVLKKDLVTALIQHVCKHLTDEEQQQLIDKLSPATKPSEEGKNTPSELIQAVSCLDPKEQDQFKELVNSCVQELELQHQKAMARLKPSARKAAAMQSETNEQKPACEEPCDTPKQEDDKLKQDLDTAMESAAAQDPPLAHHREQPLDRQPRAKGRSRRATPQCLKDLLPNIDSLYLAWMPENRMVQVDFQGLWFGQRFSMFYV